MRAERVNKTQPVPDPTSKGTSSPKTTKKGRRSTSMIALLLDRVLIKHSFSSHLAI